MPCGVSTAYGAVDETFFGWGTHVHTALFAFFFFWGGGDIHTFCCAFFLFCTPTGVMCGGKPPS